jgi:hypothetical protein
VLHATPFSLFSTWLPEQYLVESTEHEAPHYVVFSTLLLPRPSEAVSLLYIQKPTITNIS